MQKKITLSADEKLIQKAQKKAKSQRVTLNSLFLKWLEKYTATGDKTIDYETLMDKFSYAKPAKQLTREEMNER